MRTYKKSYCSLKQKKLMALVIITIAMILQFHTKGCVGCVETERVGLLQLKSYLNSIRSPKEEIVLDSWSDDDPKSDCCKWEGVYCSDATVGHIVYLSLVGLLPRSRQFDPSLAFNLSLLHSFPQLKTLDCSWNRFTHLFDPMLGNKSLQRLENLEKVDLSYNYFNNSVVPFLVAARSLRILNLGGNILEGVFPPNGLINFRELEELDLSANSINDFKAGDGLSMTKLKKLDLSLNDFSETVRLKGLEHLVRLEVLSMASNRFNQTQSIEGSVFPSSLQVLNLKNNGLFLTHEDYSKLCGLKNLRELDLSKNALTIMLHCLGNLSRLQTLDLSKNELNGNLSAFVSCLPSSLKYLSLLHNNFNGSFLFRSLVNRKNLVVFKLSSKVGTIHAQAESSWIPLFQLKVLQLNNFNLGNTIPGFLLYQHDLIFIDLSHNNLRGAFPTWLLQNNTGLIGLYLNNNSFTELQLPRFVHDSLQVLDISSNRIYDSIQQDIGIVFPNMILMNFSSNHFRGTIPSSMGEMKSIATLDMSSNSLSGQLPKFFLRECYFLNFLKLSNNKLQGEIFPEYSNLTGLGFLLVDGNNFSGSLGKGLVNSMGLEILDISYNSFSGMLPLWIGRLSSLVIVNMRGNELKGPFPHQLLSSSSTLEYMDISHNRFSGSIPRNMILPSLKELRLQNNEFMGSIPQSLFNAEKIQILDLRNNYFSGMTLNNMGDGERSDLLVLLLRNNSLQNQIPENICQLSKIRLLDLSQNRFQGGIPACFGNMSFGVETDTFIWSDNRVTFFIYLPFSENWLYSSPLYLNDDERDSESAPETVVNFSTKSRYESYEGNILHIMYGLDLSSNQLSGKIPVEIGVLHEIRSLSLSNNHLTGSIPGSISNLKNLESLDLSNNKLEGNIPPLLADLNSLGYFNVSFNNLSGEIPFKDHLVTFERWSYVGNDHLCGLPTNISCNPARVLEPDASTHDEEDEDGAINMVFFYWTCAAVYISTSLALFAFLCIESRWSQEWFYRVDLFIHHVQRYKHSCF